MKHDMNKGREIAVKLNLLKYEAMQSGFYRTGQLLEIPLQEIGWEMQGVTSPEEQKKRQQEILTP